MQGQIEVQAFITRCNHVFSFLSNFRHVFLVNEILCMMGSYIGWLGPVFPGSRGKGRVRCVGLWWNLQISDHLVTDQLACFSSYSKINYYTAPGVFSLLQSLNLCWKQQSHYHVAQTDKSDRILQAYSELLLGIWQKWLDRSNCAGYMSIYCIEKECICNGALWAIET